MRYMQITIYILATCLCFLNADVQRGQVQGQVAQLLAEQEVLRGPRTVLYCTVLYCTVLYCVLYRYAAPGDRVGKPGPGAYMSEKVNTKQSNPEYSFGVKHSKYVFMAKPDPGIPVRPLPY